MCQRSAFKPPDGGYGWVVVICFIFINSSLLPLVQCFGIIYSSKFSAMNISAAETSFLLHLNTSVMCSLGLISGPLLRRFNFRQVCFIGGALICLGNFLTTFAQSYGTLLFTMSFIIGVGQGIMMPGLYIAVNSYFKERLTLAISLQVTGASLSQIFMPQVCHYLLQHYDVHGTVLILSGISFNALPVIILLRPIPTISQAKRKPTSDFHDVEKQHVSERLLSPVYRETTIPVKIKRDRLKEIIKTLDLGLFGDRVYVIIIVGLSVSFASELNVVLMMPFILSELADFSNENIANAMSVQSIADITGRLAIPILAYRSGVPPKLMYIASLVGSSIGRTLLTFFYGNFYMVFLVSSIIGLAKGIKAVFQSVIIPKYVPSEKLAAATGLSMAVNGILSLLLGPLIGLTHGIGDSYIYPLHTATILSMTCVLLWAIDYFCINKPKNNAVATTDTWEIDAPKSQKI